MDTHTDAPEPVLLMIADISGYTRYMTANAKTLAHSQAIITELVRAIVKQVELPIEVAKLEGDAVFLFCRKQASAPGWPQTKRIIGQKLLTFFDAFGAKVAELSQSATCSCRACMHIDKLRLKIVVHSGEALFHRVLNFLELAGVDVIIVHRLLKNSVSAEQYLLLTDAARHDVELGESISLANGSEDYDDIGRINTFIHLPPTIDDFATPGATTESVTATNPKPTLDSSTFAGRFGKSWKLFWKLLFAPLISKSPEQGGYHHITADSSRLARFGLSLMTVVLAPLFLLVGAFSVFIRALNPQRASQSRDHERKHKEDGSCRHR